HHSPTPFPTRRSSDLRLDDAEAERLVEVDEMKQRCRAAEHVSPAVCPDGTDVRHARTESRLHEPLEVVAILDDPCDQQRHSDPLDRKSTRLNSSHRTI